MKTSKILQQIQKTYPKALIHNRVEGDDSWCEIIIPTGFVTCQKLAIQYGKIWSVKDSNVKKILEEIGVKCRLEDRNF